ncbi:MAG: hypothetical protein JWR05_2226 [Mucilaginibacter sp.]|nr:hypothetical protein [Mucilaginibacter sp.]
MCITVIIPSYRRAKYLKTALESVKQQTVLNKIDRIIVSENSTDLGAKEVCDTFPELNIDFFQQDGNWSAVEHLSWIINQSDSEFTAMLHDDDWWYTSHLQIGLEQLQQPDTSAYFSNFIFVKDETGTDATFHHANMISYVAEKNTCLKPLHLSFEDVCCLCYIYTPFHMSAMMAKTAFLKHANNDGLKNAKPWYADRILYPYLSLHGKIALNIQVLVGIRNHANNDAKTIDNTTRYNSHAEGALKIKVLAEEKSVDVLDRWKKIITQLPQPEVEKLYNVFHEYFGSQNNAMFIQQLALPVVKRSISIKQILKSITPYGIIKYLNKK